MAIVPPFHEAGAGRPLVFLHGWTMDGSIFTNQFARLAAEFHCLAPDLPGHGSNGNDRPSVAGAADELRALLDAEDLNDVVLVGWSLGALVAWCHLAETTGSRVTAMISVDMSPKPVNDPGWDFGLCGLDTDACLATTSRFRNHWTACIPALAAGMFANRCGPADLPFDRAVDRIASNRPAAMVAMWESLLAADLRDNVARLPVPLLVTHGRVSRVYAPATARWLTDNAPNAKRHEFSASGHSPHLEEPDAFARTVSDFASST